MKRVYLTVALTSALMLLLFGFLYSFGKTPATTKLLKIGFIYENDVSTPYTYNFSLAEDALLEQYGSRIQIMVRSNVQDNDTEAPARELAQSGCGIIFCNSYSDQFRTVARDYPDVQFCQASFPLDPEEELPPNYHTFKGKACQGRYVSGIAAGMKLNEMIENHMITADQALVGYVAGISNAEVISGYTAFLLGVRSVCPTATMYVRYTNTWGNFNLEKQVTAQLIEEGCRIISQHSDTIGPALACEEAFVSQPVYLVGYNTSMLDAAPSSALVSTCINWTPYILGAVEAVRNHNTIEKEVEGDVHGNDMRTGFDLD